MIPRNRECRWRCFLADRGVVAAKPCNAWMAQLVRAQVSYLRMTIPAMGNPEVMSSILIPGSFLLSLTLEV